MLWTAGRRGAATVTASAAVLCVAALVWFLASGWSGTGADGGYVAAGAAGPSGDPGHAMAPNGTVTFVPLDGTPGPAASAPRGPGKRPGSGSGIPPSAATGRTPSATATDPGTAAPDPGRSNPPPASPTAPGSPSAPGDRPAQLTAGVPQQAAADRRWCQYVTVTFANSGDLPATSGTVTFATHVIGLLGVDWATIDTTENLPVPIAGGRRVEGTWEICVDAWRVPLGMHIETRSAAVNA